jgi:hypothetical protein
VSADVVQVVILAICSATVVYRVGYFVGWVVRNKAGFDELEATFKGQISALEKHRDALAAVVDGKAPVRKVPLS